MKPSCPNLPTGSGRSGDGKHYCPKVYRQITAESLAPAQCQQLVAPYDGKSLPEFMTLAFHAAKAKAFLNTGDITTFYGMMGRRPLTPHPKRATPSIPQHDSAPPCVTCPVMLLVYMFVIVLSPLRLYSSAIMLSALPVCLHICICVCSSCFVLIGCYTLVI